MQPCQRPTPTDPSVVQDTLAQLVGHIGINASILDLCQVKVAHLPVAPSDVHRLLHVQAEHLPGVALEPQLPLAQMADAVLADALQVHRRRAHEAVVIGQLRGVLSDADADEILPSPAPAATVSRPLRRHLLLATASQVRPSLLLSPGASQVRITRQKNLY